MKILVINAGSSSLKFQVIDMDNESVIAKGICEEIGGKSGFKFKVPGREDYKVSVSLVHTPFGVEFLGIYDFVSLSFNIGVGCLLFGTPTLILVFTR